MALNQPKIGTYVPNPIGPVRLVSRSGTRSRSYLAGTFFRSLERGESANAIKIGVFEDLFGPGSSDDEGVCVVQHTVLNPSTQIVVTGMSAPMIELRKLNLDWNYELRISHNGTEFRCVNTGIRWQIAAGPVPVPVDLGPVTDGLFTGPGISFKVQGISTWPTGAVVVLRPRVRRYTLVPHVVTDTDTMISATGWDPSALRATLNADTSGFVRMPERGTGLGPLPDGEDKQDEGVDEAFVTTVPMTNMTGGNGLPASPVGLNTGPDRVLVHLNYGEKDDGSMGEVNQVYEWVGDSASVGSWQRYS